MGPNYLDILIQAEFGEDGNIVLEPGSRMQLDDEVTNPLNLSHMVAYCQSMAFDNLQAFRNLVTDAESGRVVIPFVAQYSLLRSAIESSVQAIWLLSPDLQKERVTRLLQARASDLAFDSRLIATASNIGQTDSHDVRSAKNRAVKESRDRRRRQRQLIRDVAEPFSIEQLLYDASLPSYGAMSAEAALSAGVDPGSGEAIWIIASGLTHPSASRAIAASVLEDLDPGRPGHQRTVRMTTNVKQLNQVVGLAIVMYARCDRLRRIHSSAV